MNEAALDLQVLAALFGDDRDALAELIVNAARRSNELVAEIAAVSPADDATVPWLAHELKGLAGNVGARSVASIAGQLESMAKAQTAPGLDETVDHLRAAVDDFATAAEALWNEVHAPAR